MQRTGTGSTIAIREPTFGMKLNAKVRSPQMNQSLIERPPRMSMTKPAVRAESFVLSSTYSRKGSPIDQQSEIAEDPNTKLFTDREMNGQKSHVVPIHQLDLLHHCELASEVGRAVAVVLSPRGAGREQVEAE